MSLNLTGLRIRMIDELRHMARHHAKIVPQAITAQELHDECLRVARKHPNIADYEKRLKDRDEVMVFPVGVGQDLVDTTRYWLGAGPTEAPAVLWEGGFHIQLSDNVKSYLRAANLIQNDAIKYLVKEIGNKQ